jgi:hypothetical protein
VISIDPDRGALACALGERRRPNVERRAAPRHPREAVPEITSMRVLPGESATLINISASGLLMEGTKRFPPGVPVTVVFDGSIAMRSIGARVVRCQVTAISPTGILHYQTALAFEGRLVLAVDATTPVAAQPGSPFNADE